MEPKVSVCIPTYNYALYICDAIESVLNQTYSDFELIIIDDCSTDNTKDLVFKFKQSDNRIKYIQNENRLGFTRNFTRCVEVAKGEYVKILCADDTLESNCLEKMVKALDTYDQVSLVASARMLVDKKLEPIRILSYAAEFKLLHGIDVIKKCIFSGNLIGEPTAVIFRKKDASRGFNDHYKLLVDLEMWLYLLEKGDFVFLPETLCKFRQHENQATYDCVKTLSFIEDNDKLYREYIQRPFMHNTFINAMRKRFGMTFIIWTQRNIINNQEMLQNSISKYMNYYFALLIMPIYSAFKTLLLRNGSVS
jgi:glycosyltransferase involved in cell wall biosynthesis